MHYGPSGTVVYAAVYMHMADTPGKFHPDAIRNDVESLWCFFEEGRPPQEQKTTRRRRTTT